MPLARLAPILAALFLIALPARAGDMTLERLDALIHAVGEGVLGKSGTWEMSLEDVPVIVVTDADADLMRILTPIRSAGGLDEAELMRLMQANFDTTLDARYAVGRGVLWSAFIHPLSQLEDDEFLSALGQVVNLALTYGGSYASGAIAFGGGDSGGIEQRELIERLLEQGGKI